MTLYTLHIQKKKLKLKNLFKKLRFFLFIYILIIVLIVLFHNLNNI